MRRLACFRNGLYLTVRQKVVDCPRLLGMLSIKRLGSRNPVTNRRQADLIVLDGQNNLRISMEAHRFANRCGQNHSTITSHFNVYGLHSHGGTLPYCLCKAYATSRKMTQHQL
jgi:hypothetical protein